MRPSLCQLSFHQTKWHLFSIDDNEEEVLEDEQRRNLEHPTRSSSTGYSLPRRNTLRKRGTGFASSQPLAEAVEETVDGQQDAELEDTEVEQINDDDSECPSDTGSVERTLKVRLLTDVR